MSGEAASLRPCSSQRGIKRSLGHRQRARRAAGAVAWPARCRQVARTRCGPPDNPEADPLPLPLPGPKKTGQPSFWLGREGAVEAQLTVRTSARLTAVD